MTQDGQIANPLDKAANREPFLKRCRRSGLRRGRVETRLILCGAVAFAVCIHFGVRSSFRLFRGFAWSTVAICDRSSVLTLDFRANEASYVFIAAIIAGIPMIFITRVIL